MTQPLPCALDASPIADRLFQGSWPGPARMLYGHRPTLEELTAPRYTNALRSCGIDVLVLCAQELQDRRYFPGLRVVRAPLDDSAVRAISEGEWRVARAAAREVALRIAAGQTVLVTCAMGRNRSGLVSALALRHLTGCSGARAARIVRALRPHALTNTSFVERLLQLPGRAGGVRRR